MSQRARTFKVNCCLKDHNAHQNLLSPISGYVAKESGGNVKFSVLNEKNKIELN